VEKNMLSKISVGYRLAIKLLRRIANGIKNFFLNIYFWLGLLFFTLSLTVTIGGHYIQYHTINLPILFRDLYTNIGTEFASIAITILFIDTISRGIATKERKRDLILQMSSTEPSIAREAVRILRIEGWISDGTLRNARLEHAALIGSNLESANLQKVDLDHATLDEANLFSANLRGSSLVKTKFRKADLPLADLSGANLLKADLENAIVDGAILDGANLERANLVGVPLSRAKLDEHTILPDGTRYTDFSELKKFTDPTHPEFWRSTDPDSPAYQG